MRTYQCNLISNLNKWLKRKSRKIDEEHRDAALTLLIIGLEPVRKYLQTLYSPNPRGRPHYDPVCMLRALLLMTFLGFKSYTFWVKELRNITTEKEKRQKQKETDVAQYDSVTKKLKDELQKTKEQPRPDDLLKTLEDILITCAIIPSAEKGMLGDTSKLNLCGDGSALPSGANHNGKPSCQCHKNGIYKCNHDRYYSDAIANWGYDSYRECYYFGHTYYQHIVNHNGHDLPMHVSIEPAAETDFTQSMKDFDRLQKTLKEHGLDWEISHVVYDAGMALHLSLLSTQGRVCIILRLEVLKESMMMAFLYAKLGWL